MWAKIQSLLMSLREEYEFQAAQLFLYFPIFLACGIGLYFWLPFEPPLIWGIAALVPMLLALCVPILRASPPIVVLFLVALGFFGAQIRTHSVHTPILQEDIGPTMIEGDIVAIEDYGAGGNGRLLLDHVTIEDLPAAQTPRKVRVKIWNDDGLYVGQRIRTLGKVHVPSAPVLPGGFDFQRYLYFQGIGGVGFTYKNAQIIRDVNLSSWGVRIEALRQTLAQRLEHAMQYPEAGIAMALTIGRKTAIMPSDQEAMRAAGLAHMLAISGLHLGLVSGAVFFAVRLFLIFIPGLALRYPIKKIAAVVAILAACFYMFVAGATIPTQRALLMTGIVFIAIILDRSPISMRLVAFAAFMVLLIFPESLLSASFHMSFSAVVCLIAFYSATRPWWERQWRAKGIIRRSWLYLVGVCSTTIIATIATAPFALYHFQQLAAYGLLGNVLAMPVMAFIVMPSIVMSFLLMPLGLEWLSLSVTELGISGMLNIAHYVEALPHSVFLSPAWSLLGLIFIVLAGLTFILFRGLYKGASALFFVISMFYIFNLNQFFILISSSNKLISVRDENSLYVSSKVAERFTRENWTQYYGMSDRNVEKFPKEGRKGPVICDSYGCRVDLGQGGAFLSYVLKESAAPQACGAAEIVVASFPLRNCRAPHVIDLYAGRKDGAHALMRRKGVYEIVRTESLRGVRPWAGMNQYFDPWAFGAASPRGD